MGMEGWVVAVVAHEWKCCLFSATEKDVTDADHDDCAFASDPGAGPRAADPGSGARVEHWSIRVCGSGSDNELWGCYVVMG